MTCPNCSAAAPEGATDCAACGVVFEKWLRKASLEKLRVEEPVAGQTVREAAAEPADSEGVSVPVAPLAAAAVLAALAAYALTSSGGRAPGPSAAKLPGGFFVRAPEGWNLRVPACEGAGPCPVEFSRSSPDAGEAAAEVKGALELTLSGAVYSAGPRAAPQRDDELDTAYLGDWRAQVDSFQMGPRRWGRLEGLDCLRVSGSGPKHLRVEVRKPLVLKEREAVAKLRELNPGKTVLTYQARLSGKKGDYVPEVMVDPGEYREADYQVALEALLVSARDRTLRLACRVDAARQARCAALLDELERGLVAVERPRRLDVWLGTPLK